MTFEPQTEPKLKNRSQLIPKFKKMAISRRSRASQGTGAASSISQPSTSATAGDSAESESDSEPLEMKGYRPLSCETLGSAVSEGLVCSKCGSAVVVREDLNNRRGLVSTLEDLLH